MLFKKSIYNLINSISIGYKSVTSLIVLIAYDYGADAEALSSSDELPRLGCRRQARRSGDQGPGTRNKTVAGGKNFGGPETRSYGMRGARE